MNPPDKPTLEHELAATERLRFAADADRRRLRAEVEKWQSVAATMSSEREHNANEAGRLRAEVERLNALGSWAHTCIHHTDEQRARAERCSVCATAERDQLRAEVVLDEDLQAATEKSLKIATIRAERAEAEIERWRDSNNRLRAEMESQAQRAERAEADCVKWQRLLLMSRDDREIDLLSALKLMVAKFDAFIDSEYCGTDLLAEQLAQADFARKVIREAESAPFGT